MKKYCRSTEYCNYTMISKNEKPATGEVAGCSDILRAEKSAPSSVVLLPDALALELNQEMFEVITGRRVQAFP